MHWLQPEREVSRVVCYDDDPEGFRQAYDEIEAIGGWKVTITFNRKYWKKGRALSRCYEVVKGVLDESDVYKAIFAMELHDSGWPHLHGFVCWKSDFYESPGYLRNKFVIKFGQTKIFKYKPEEYLESQAKKKGIKKLKEDEDLKSALKPFLEYDSWYDYITKKTKTMLVFKHQSDGRMQVTMGYERIEDEEEEENFFLRQW